MSEKGSAADVRRPVVLLVGCGVALFAASILMSGYKVYYHNQSLQIPLVHLLNDPSLYPNDPFAATLPYYASAVWRVVAWGSRAVGLEPLLLGLFLIERMLLLVGAARLAMALAPGSRNAPVWAMAFFAMCPTPFLGGGTISMPYFEQTGLAVAFLLLAMAAFYRGRAVEWAIWMGIALNCNSMYGAYALTYFAAAFIADPGHRREWRRWLGALLGSAVLALPSIWMTGSAYSRGAVDDRLWITAARLRVPHHLFPMTWSPVSYVKFNAVLFATLVVLWTYRTRVGGLLRGAGVLAAVAMAWLGFAFAAAWIESPAMLVVQPTRATDLWYCFALAAIGAALGLRVGSGARVALLVTLAAFLAGAGTFGMRAEQKSSVLRALYWTPGLSERQAAAWAQSHTPRDAVFLVNPNWGDFRALSKRPVFVTWKDGSALLWYRPFVTGWVERLREIGYDVSRRGIPGRRIGAQLDSLYTALTDDRVLCLSRAYGVRYWVVPAGRASRFPVVYRNRLYKVLKAR